MYCTSCGLELKEGATVCKYCGCPVFPIEKRQNSSSHFLLAILASIIAFPFGLISLYFSFKARKFQKSGEVEKSLKCIKRSNILAYVFFGVLFVSVFHRTLLEAMGILFFFWHYFIEIAKDLFESLKAM